MPCSLHSDSNHQTNNNGHTHLLVSSMSISSSTRCISVYWRSPGTRFHCMLHQQHSTWHTHIHFQVKFLHLPGRLSSTFRTARSQSKLALSISDGGSQLCPHPSNAEEHRLYPARYPPQPGQAQPRGHPLLSPEITNVYVGLVVRQFESCLYTPDQILDFVKDIEVDLQVTCDALKAGGNPRKRHAYCLFVDNLSGAMSIPTDPPYCLLYPTSYVKGVELDHFDTCNSPAGMHLHRCVCSATLQFSNGDPKEHTMSGVASSCPTGCSTTICCTLLF